MCSKIDVFLHAGFEDNNMVVKQTMLEKMTKL